MTTEQEVLKDLKKVTLEELDEAIKAVDKQEQEAIEYFKKHIKYFEEQIKFIEATDCDYYDEELELYQNRVKQFNTVLFMLEEKDKQIDKLKKHNDELLRKLRNRVKEVTKLEKYSLYKKEFSRLNKQLQNKDKIIDLMSEQLAGLAIFNIDKDETLILSDKEEVKQYYENEAKELLNK